MDTITTIVTVMGTVLAGGASWKFFEKRLAFKHDERSEEREEKTLYRNDLKERVKKLEDQLAIQLDENKRLQQTILQITKDNQITVLGLVKDISMLEQKVTQLEKENERLKRTN